MGLQGELKALESRVRNLEKLYGKSHPKVVVIRRQISSKKKKIKRCPSLREVLNDFTDSAVDDIVKAFFSF